MSLPTPLLQDIANGRCLPFLGAGFSMNAKLDGGTIPGWRELKERLAKDARVSPDLPGPDIASAFERRFGRVQLVEAIRESLYVAEAKPGDAHLAFAQLPFETVYTTNFDLLLEDAYTEIGKSFRSLVGEHQMPFHGGSRMTSIVKMHGDLRHEERIVITAQDYAGYMEQYPVLSTHLAAMLITKTPLFLGYSLTDTNFLQIQKIVESRLGKFRRMAYLVQFDVPESEQESRLDNNIHVISLEVGSSSRQQVLGDWLKQILRYLDEREGKRLRASRPDLFENVPVPATATSEEEAVLLTSASSACYVSMALTPEFQQVFDYGIVPAVNDAGLKALRADYVMTSSPIAEQARAAIQNCRLFIAHISDQNSNVMYEIGLAQSLNKPTVLIARKTSSLPGHLLTQAVLIYDLDHLETFRQHLSTTIDSLYSASKLKDANRLIHAGHYRGAMATLSVLMEQRLLKLRAPASPKRNLTIRMLLDDSLIARLLPEQLIPKLRTAARLRDKAMRSSEEPTKDDALLMYDAVAHLFNVKLPPVRA